MPGFRYRGGAGGYFKRGIKRAVIRGKTPLIGNKRNVNILLTLILVAPICVVCLAGIYLLFI